MDALLLLGLCVLCIVGIAPAIARPEKVYEYPAFMAIAFLIFILPQAYSLFNFPGAAEGRPLTGVLAVTFFCLLACLVGYKFSPSKRFYYCVANVVFDEERLLKGGLVFLGIAMTCGMLIRGMSAEETGGSTWTGKVVIYAFFCQMTFPATAILLRHALKRGTGFAWGMLFLAFAPTLEAVVLAGRREIAVYFALTLALVLYFERRMLPQRYLIVVVVVAAMLAIPATSKYRSIASQKNWGALKEMNVVQSFTNYLNGESILELRNAAMIIDVHREHGRYSYGVAYWDEMVWRFVPAQIVGAKVKQGLMIERGKTISIQEWTGYATARGSTVTGMADSFIQFGFLGWMVFIPPAIFFRTLWIASHAENGFLAQLLYIGSITSAMRAVTHQTVDFLPGVGTQALFLAMLWMYAARPRRALVLGTGQRSGLAQ